MIEADRLEIINKAVQVLNQGGIILAPTDTVWGLMCDYASEESVHSLFAIKNSPAKPVALLIDSLERLSQLKINVPPFVNEISNRYWPGPLTLIFKSALENIGHIAGENNSVGVRMPAADDLLELIKLFGKPLAASSANIAKQKQPMRFEDIPDEITMSADFICKFEIKPSGVSSTVIDCTSEKFKILREGEITLENLEKTVSRDV